MTDRNQNPEQKARDNIDTTQMLFEPLDFIDHLASLMKKLRVKLTRDHCVFTPNSRSMQV